MPQPFIAMTRPVEIRRLYQPVSAKDGFRVFIDRLWPRGMSKDEFEFDLWCKDLAPSPDLRKWFGHQVQNWPTFSERYRTELQSPEQRRRIDDVLDQAGKRRIILLYGAKDPDHNHAIILAREFDRVRETLARNR